ncbi:trypsin-like peptidase domain-containing protein [Saccharothrix luteola]|uniref:trypsin-like peptidase domain-containing protein n=1 Tax=Saccharothrix luteola TaxID=2893018 RepID=UPI001E377C88|nr:trypsin-like peptidase domain-containing protein [Saccharothrix luteola]MCC8248678.1 trypsin-like peptidase domain-containing protein [Saccharothrix luteola]
MPDGSLPSSVVRFTDAAGRTVGAGVVLGRHVVTCAHVVNLALGLDPRSAARPAETVEVDFPALNGETATARVRTWTPPPPREGSPGDDIATLDLDLPGGVTPARLATTPLLAGSTVDVFGYPANRPDGAWTRAVVRGRVGGRLVQLDSESALAVQRGYSGSPVWDHRTGRVVGIVATAASQDSYAIAADRLREELPGGPDELTVLHLAGTRFGSGQATWSPTDFAEARPDLVVFTGDLTEHGRPDEFERGFRFLAELADAVKLPRERVVVVPGSRDVNRLACEAYFRQEEAWGRIPKPPYWPKWGPFAAAFEEFHGARFSFTPDEPWTLFDYPELDLVVAGLNSTVDITHRGDGLGLGQRQVERFGELLRDLRHGAVKRLSAVQGPLGVQVPVDVDLPLTSLRDEPATWSLVAVPAHGVAQWTASPVRSARSVDTFFDRVLEATRVAHPTATVTPRAEAHYIRVSKPRAGGGFEQWPVGVATKADIAAVDAFADHVHASFAAADPAVPSELVYSGPPAAPELVAAARRRGVRLRSFVEYQGLLDLRSLAERQTRRLAGDGVYPADLYVPQRFGLAGSQEKGDDLLRRVLAWLGEDVARFVVVLGDFGRGKSFLLRQLTRALPAEHPGLLPVLVELRSLEKGPSLDELLAQHLVGEGVDAVEVAKLRYMIRSGRLALLFDGFDELELRVGYDNAADYLSTLLQAVTDRAKVVLTSRSQHFQSTDQVLNALGRRVSALTASRVAVLEDFTDDQIRDFLTRHYGGDAARAAARFELLGAINDLLGLSRNPRMLSFIADLDDERLHEVRRQHGRISAAELYRELVDFWLVQEVDRQRHRHGTPSFDGAERLSACTALALRLWQTTATTIDKADLEDTVVRTLTRLTERGYSIDQAAHAVGSGSLLVRTEAGGFAFVHQSVMEWLVAKVAADELPGTEIVNRKMSRLMVDFLCDLAGHEAALSWARGVLADVDAPDAAKHNATEVARRLEARVHLSLAGTDLRGFDFGHLDLRGADLSEADLSGQRLHGKDFAGTNLSGANLTGVRLVGGDLTGAVLTGSRWRRAALLGVAGPTPEEAAVSGRDPATPTLAPLGADVAAVAFSPDGDLAAVAHRHVVELRHLGANQPVRVWRRRAHPIVDVAYAQNGRLIATLEADGGAYMWDAETGELVTRLPQAQVGHGYFVAGGNRFVTKGPQGAIRLWDARSGEVVRELPGFHHDLVASADGRVIVTRAGREVEVRRTDNLKLVAAFAPVAGARLAVSRSGATVAHGATTNLTVVDARSGDELAVIPSYLSRVDGMVFLDERRLALTQGDQYSIVTTNGALVASSSRTSRVTHIRPTGDGMRFAVTADDGLAVIRTPDDRRSQWLNDDPHLVGSASYSPDGRSLITTSVDGMVRVWDLRTGAVRSEFDGEMGFRRLAAFSSAGTTMAFAVPSGIKVIGSGEELIPVDGVVHSLALSTGGHRLVASSADVVTCWNLPEQVPLTRFEHDGAAINAVAMHPAGGRFATAHRDGLTYVWDIRMTGRVELARHTGDVWGVAFSPDGHRVATASADGTARVWRLDGRETARLEGHDGMVLDVVFSRDSRRIATASSDGTARIWSETGEHLVTLTGHTGDVRSVAFSPDGSRIATTADDGTARIWDAGTGAELAVLVHGVGGTAVVLPDGSYKVSGDVGDRLWWAVKQVRFEVGELDPYYPDIRRLGVDDVLPGVTS